jgi:YbbR domain-containing protein
MKAPWPFGNLPLKALSVGIAVLLWLFVAGDETVERGLRVPLEFQQLPAGVEMIGEAPSLVDVRVRGGTTALSQLDSSDVVAQLDLKAARVGRHLYQITPEQVRVPFGVQVVQVVPPSVALAFEVSASKEVPVVPEIEGDPVPGFVVGKVAVDPPTVQVVGPQSAISRVTEAVTEPVTVAGARTTVRDSVTIGFVDPSLRLKTPRLAQVTVEVNPGPVERTVMGRPVHLLNIGANLVARAEPNTVDVVVRGSREGVSSVEDDEVVVSLDLEGLGTGSYTLPVRVDSPQQAGVARILPATIQVSIASGRN